MKFNTDDISDYVIKKESSLYPGLFVHKYTRDVFYKKLWDKDERIEEARGIVTDGNNNVIVRPFKKIYNYGERVCDLPLGNSCVVVNKINGFLGVVSINPHTSELIYSTTGSLDSDFAKLAKKVITSTVDKDVMQEYFEVALFEGQPISMMFEICDPTDPHIIVEQAGAYLTGIRNINTGRLENERVLDYVGKDIKALRPAWIIDSFQNALEEVKHCTREGFIIRGMRLQEDINIKIKSPFYLQKKALQRISKNTIVDMFTNVDKFIQNKQLDEEFIGLVRWVTSTFEEEQWANMLEADRSNVIHDYFNDHSYMDGY
jgi:hypothetical protein